MPRRTLGRLLALGLVTQTARLGAQAAPAPAAAPRVAVVLSGGGAKGLAHVGVLRVLEEEGVSPQIVAGTSMGALIGGLYAMGDSPAVLDSLARHLDWNAYFNDAPARALLGLDRRLQGDRTVLELPLTRAGPTLPAGVLGGQRIGELLARLTWHAQLVRDFRTLPRSFVAVATDIGRGEAVALDHGSLATVMQASMALPSVFAPVTLDGRVFIDGGVTRNLPAQDARALGAAVVICSDVSEGLVPAAQLHTLVDVLTQAVSIHDAASAAAERARCDVYIRPDITGLTGTSYDSAGVAIARGVAAADAVREALRAFRSASPPAARARHGAWPDSIRVARVVVEGVTGNAERAARDGAARYAIGTRAHGWVTADRLDSLVQQLYSSERYDGVRSRLEATGGDTAVVLSLAPRAQDRLGVGLRYDDTFRAAILLTARIRSRVDPGATTQLDLRLGEQLRASIERAWASLRDPRAHYAIAAAYTETHLPIYDGDRRVAQAKLAVVTARGFVGRTFGTAGGIGIQLKGEHSRASSDVSAGDSASRAQTVASGALLLAWDALDRADFPRRGVEAIARSERAVGGTRFVQHLARGQLAVPLAPRVTLRGRAVVGASTAGDALPLQSRFAVGGTYPAPLYPDMQVPLVGLHPQEQLGAAAVAVGPGVQVELRPNVFATVRGDVGYAGRALTLDRRVYRSGGAASLGALTAFGPAELTVSRATGRRRARVEFALGHRF